MKKAIYFLSFIILSLSFSCSDDETSTNDSELSYDQGPNSAPIFGEGVHIAAARFPSSITSSFSGQSLDRVEFYLVRTPSNTKIRIYDEDSPGNPGTMLYEADVTSSVNPDSWNSHTLTEDVVIADRDLWIAVEVTHPDERNTIGCDVGPALSNGDWVLEHNQIEWQTYRDFTSNAVDINWNIRGFIE